MKQQKAISLVITGASGSCYGLRLLEALIEAKRHVYLMISDAGRVVIETELGLTLPTDLHEAEAFLAERCNASPGQLQLFGNRQWEAPVASGSNAPEAMVIAPCTMGTLSAIACGASNNLIERAADVMLKERRPLLLLAREAPFSEIHLENMLKLARMGVTIMPACPGFYHRPQSVDELVDFMVARILDHLAIEHQLQPRWGA
ncbi:MAG: UbiX family flavin prenyltransferase [Candidatus Polarisedimenticolaceae bacterium]|nr:UbiX family flavin prenyltransferase [Candidatus Polarisedimenticolaceae bacterium]